MLLCYVAGAGPCFLFAVLGALFESVVRRRVRLAVGCLCAVGAVPFGAAFFLETDLASEFKHWGNGSTLWLTLGLYLFFPIAISVRRAWKRHRDSENQPAEMRSVKSLAARENSSSLEAVGQSSNLPVPGASVPRALGGTMPLNPADKMSAPLRLRLCLTGTGARSQLVFHLVWVLFALAAGLTFLTFDSHRKALIQLDRFAMLGKWDDVLKTAPRVQGFAVSSFLHINRALFLSGRMADDMFAFRQFKGLDLLPGLNMGVGHSRALSGTLLNWARSISRNISPTRPWNSKATGRSSGSWPHQRPQGTSAGGPGFPELASEDSFPTSPRQGLVV